MDYRIGIKRINFLTCWKLTLKILFSRNSWTTAISSERYKVWSLSSPRVSHNTKSVSPE